MNSVRLLLLTVLVALFFIPQNLSSQERDNFIRLDRSFDNKSRVSEDSYGYIWITDRDGLYKYDGYNFTLTPYSKFFGKKFSNQSFIIKKDSQKNIWLSSFNGDLIKIDTLHNQKSFKDVLLKNGVSNKISTIKDDSNTVWFGSVAGTVYKYNTSTKTIDTITSLPTINNSEQEITSLVFTSKNSLWISTAWGNIYNYKTDTNNLSKLKSPHENESRYILLTTDNYGQLWIATELSGLYSYNPNLMEFKSYSETKNKDPKNKQPMYIALYTDKQGIIWAGTDGDGLYRIDPENKSVSVYRHDETNIFSISNNTIIHLSEDSHGNKWIITKKGELNILPNNENKIRYYNGLPNNTPTRVLCSFMASDKSLWIGTDGKGLNRVFPNGEKLHYGNNKKGSSFFEGKYIQGLTEDQQGNIWIATYQNGLWIYNHDQNKFYKKALNDPHGQFSTDIRHLFKDKKEQIWVSSGTGIHVFDKNSKQIGAFMYRSKGLRGYISQAIAQDENGDVWIGIDNEGLFKFTEDKQEFSQSRFIKHEYYQGQDANLYSHTIVSIQPDYKGGLWILNVSGFLTYYNIDKEIGKTYIKNQHLQDIQITSILLENPSSLWLGSKSGLHHYNVVTNELKSYYRTDGLQGNRFVLRSAYKADNSKLYFGGDNGLSSFFPYQLNQKKGNAQIYINNIDILNKPAKEILGSNLKGRIEELETLKLSANQTSFAFQFSAIDNILNSNYHYAYKLNGFDNEWITPKKERIASYTNIPFGSYTFEVKAGSKNGVWDIAPKKIAIYIAPPWWRSNYAYIIYTILFSLVILSIIRWSQLRRKLASRAWQNQKEKEMYALKMNFFAKMSHEIQTPLTLILGPIDDMLQRAGSNENHLLKQRLSILKNNAKRLSRIATELMTVKNKELGKLKVLVSKNNITDHLREVSLSFSEQARFKEIEFVQKYPKEDIFLWYDFDKIEHVLYNLLANAFKFTPRGGSIILKLDAIYTDNIEISISDSGPGIPKHELDNIFKIFYQSELGKHKKGIGVGLALTKEIITLHHGEINVLSSAQMGTCFTVRLSTTEKVFSPDEKSTLDSLNEQKITSNNEVLEPETDLLYNASDKQKHTLLIVEDNVEMQIFLKDVLKNSYHLLLAENGKEGIQIAEKSNPDLIISDIMMPVIDGLEMCKKLQKKKSTSHIPIILLTAKNSSESKLRGLRSGAVEYIEKPFNFHELLWKVNNIIASKERALLKYKTDLISSPEQNIKKSKDDIFLEDLVQQLNIQMDNSNFKLEDLPNSLNMSYSVIYRKCQDITGKTLVDFVRSLRLKKAALLITEKGYNISEAAYMVGYKDPKYFAKCFKEEFGKSPSSYKRKNNKILSS